MRIEKFTMERDVLNEGDTVTITEGKLPFTYYYTVVPAAAMSGNYNPNERILSREGIVRKKTSKDGTFFLEIEFES